MDELNREADGLVITGRNAMALFEEMTMPGEISGEMLDVAQRCEEVSRESQRRLWHCLFINQASDEPAPDSTQRIEPTQGFPNWGRLDWNIHMGITASDMVMMNLQ